MTSEFAALVEAMNQKVQGHYGELTRVEPHTSGEFFGGGADSQRSPVEVVGTPDFEPKTVMSQDKSRYDGARPSITGDKIHVFYEAGVFTEWAPKKGDEIVLISTTGERLRIVKVDPDGLGGLVCVCTRRSSGD